MINTLEQNSASPKIQKVIAILWPSFLTAGVATVFFFTVFDPEIILLDTVYANASRMAAYTVGFFAFWILTASSCALACYFLKPCVITDTSRDTSVKSSPDAL